jgi:polysaccharide biosynthesis protein PslH
MNMKIAYVVPYVPNLIRTRPYNLIRQLAALGHEVSVFTLGYGEQDLKDIDALRSMAAHVYCEEQPISYSLWNSLLAVPTRRPLQMVYSWNTRLAKQLVSRLSIQDNFDIVHVEHLRGSSYGQYIKRKLPHMPVVWDSVDCISYLFMQASAHSTDSFGKFVARFELGRTRRMEGKLVGEFDHIFVTSRTDKNALLDLASPASLPSPISVLPNGVDLEFFHPNSAAQRNDESLVFSGKMSYHANISMVKYLIAEIMPRVWEKRPRVRLMIVGKDPGAAILELGTDPRIMVTGTVEDIRPYLWEAAVAVVPLVYGAGIQNKILEAMACGTPVVTTSRTLSSIDAISGRELVVADGAEEFSRAILELLDNPEMRLDIGAAGLVYVRKHHSWATVAQEMLACYADVARH